MSRLIVALLLFQVPAALQQRTGVVTGALRSEAGIPIGGVRVAVVPAGETVDYGLLESLAETDGDGRYRLENVSPGRYHVVFGRGTILYHPGGFVPQTATTIVVTAGSTISVPDMVLPRRTVSGRVFDAETGAARRISKLTACCESSLTPQRPTSFTAAVGDDGTFAFALPPGNFTIQASDDSIVTTAQSIEVPDRDIKDLVVKVSSGVEVRGTVVDAAGNPVRGGLVLRARSHNPVGMPVPVLDAIAYFAVSANGAGTVISLPRTPTPVMPSAAVGADGTFVISRLNPGRYTLEIRAPGGSQVERDIEVGPTGLSAVRIEWLFTPVAGRIVAADGGILPVVQSVRLISLGDDDRIVHAFPDADGRFVVMLAPGRYRIATDNQGHAVVSISAGAAANLRTEPFAFDGINKPEIVIVVE